MTTAEKFKARVAPQIKNTHKALADFDHPCKTTCSGWTQGTIKGEQALIARLAPITDAVAEVLDAVERVTTDESLLKLGGDAMNLAVNLILNKALAKLQAAMGDE